MRIKSQVLEEEWIKIIKAEDRIPKYYEVIIQMQDMSHEISGMRAMRRETGGGKRATTDRIKRIIAMNQNTGVTGDPGMTGSIGLKMTMTELIPVVGKNEDLQIKKRKQEVLGIMRMKAEVLKTMTRSQGNMNLKRLQEGRTIHHIRAEAQDNQSNEVQNKKVDLQIPI